VDKVMTVRKRADGTVEASIPDEHVLSARWIQRHLEEGLAEVTITIDGQAFKLGGFDRVDADNPESDFNFTAWQISRVKRGGKE
jgi:hypothetical protein